MPYLYIRYNFTHSLTEPPTASNVGDDRGRQTNEYNKEIANGEIHNEYIGYGAHVNVLGDDDDDEQIADDTNDEYGECEHEETPLEGVRAERVGEHCGSLIRRRRRLIRQRRFAARHQ